MTYVIVELCKDSKDLSCIEVCPVDCIHPEPDEPGHAEAEMLFIDPEECIDCGACAEACPVEACVAEEDVPEMWQHYVSLNASFFAEGRQG
jgi:ferredoxin